LKRIVKIKTHIILATCKTVFWLCPNCLLIELKEGYLIISNTNSEWPPFTAQYNPENAKVSINRKKKFRYCIYTIASSHQIFQKCQNFFVFCVGILYFLKNLMGTCNSVLYIQH
jgi:hypothetical protein